MKNNQKNIFTSKSNVLEYLSLILKKSKIEKLYKFEVKDWNQNSNEIIKNIEKIFKSKKIIVRSSAQGEDSISKSEAGLYESILNTKSNSKKNVRNAINTVIESYNKNNNLNQKNQILIQKQTVNVWNSGVLFTRVSETNAPYYMINYDESKSTDKVTSGQNSKIIKISRNVQDKNLKKHWKKLIESVKEIEYKLNNNFLDIEFAINYKNEIIIFQVRPITTINKKNIDVNEKQIWSNIKKQKRKFLKFANQRDDSKTIFSDMSDWNPAEIIGNDPHMLDYSLYNYIIMKNAWNLGRTKIGYEKASNSSLMVKFGNKPYVDIKNSFQSLIPKNFDAKIKRKLRDFYLEKLENNPQYYDKVEFEILFTCYDFRIKKRLKELQKKGFTKTEIIKIESNLIKFTNDVIRQFPKISSDSMNNIKKMSCRREKILKKINKKSSVNEHLIAVENLLKDCKQYGTIPFSTMARLAFISSILLKSLITEKKISKNFYNLFMNNISTVLSEFQIDLQNMYMKRISKKTFLKKYGHLRPGTYDITILPYRKNNALLQNFKMKEKKKIEKVNFSHLNKKMEKTSLEFRNIEFSDFVKLSLMMREKIKFEFTQNLSEAIELLVIAGKKLGFTREELSNLNIQQILRSFGNKNLKEIQNDWKNYMSKEIKKRKLNSYLVLPPIISKISDFDVIQYHSSKPNYITDKKIKSELIKLDMHKKIENFENKIILIKNADPGYDWIFSKNPAGLITKYGGMASHIAIRCAELGIPAAIGCGELIYEKLLVSSKIIMDCKNKQISILENYFDDEFIEEQKVLKTLGYIK